MTLEEALCWCNQFEDNIILVNPQNPKKTLALQAMKQCKEALEKQIPKVVGDYRDVEDGTFYNIDFMCPACGCTVIGQPYKPGFCKHCGQALDWSDTE